MHRATQLLRLAILPLAAALWLPSCDNPACVYSGNCDDAGGGGGGGGIGESAATVPTDSSWLSPAAPTIESFFPVGAQIATTTPMALVFSESLAPSSVGQAFELAIVDAQTPAVPLTGLLAGDGRVVVLLSTTALLPDTDYVVRVRTDRNIVDLQGSRMVVADDREVGTFSTAVTDPSAPRVVMTYPADNAVGQSRTGESVVLFDRPVNVGATSWIVTVNGQPPSPNPAPTSLAINLGQGSLDEKRVWRWRSADASGTPTPFPLSATVALRLSPSAAPITAVTGGAALPQTDLDYAVAGLSAPLSVDVGSYDVPLDYIGAANLNGLDPLAALAVEVWLFGSEPGDFVRIYLVGEDTATEPELFALYREVQLGSLDTYDSLPLQHDTGEVVVLSETEIDLASSPLPLALRFAEGDVSIAISLRRGNLTTPIKLLDVDRAATGIQPVTVDITPPELEGFGSTGSNVTSFASDGADLVVVGRANEELRAAQVNVGPLTNGFEAPVVSARPDGLFVAAPVVLPDGLVDPAAGATSFSLTIYDRAFNPSVNTTQASFEQIGAVGPGGPLPAASATVRVQVHDARTFAPVPNARVLVHEDPGLGAPNFISSGLTDAQGLAVLTAAPGAPSMVTVDASGYDLWSFVELAVDSVRVPLQRTDEAPAAGTGTATSPTSLASFQRSVSDSRRSELSSPFLAVGSCTSAGSLAVCQFGPQQLVAGPLGALSFVAVEAPLSAAVFSAASYLRSFALDLPLASASPGVPVTSNLVTTVVLSDASTAQEDRAVAGPSATLDISTAVGFLANQQNGQPRLAVEGFSPGIRGPIAVGSGVALDPVGTPAVQWSVRSAIAGAADPTNGKYPGDQKGSLIRDKVLEPNLYLRAEVRDLAGSRTGVRVPVVGAPPALLAPSVPLVASPTPFSPPVGPGSYDVVFLDSLPGSDPGIYRVTLTAANRRRWVLWVTDVTSAGTISISLPDVAAAGGEALVAGTVFTTVSAYAWPTLDSTKLCFSELDRRSEVVLDSAPVSFTQL